MSLFNCSVIVLIDGTVIPVPNEKINSVEAILNNNDIKILRVGDTIFAKHQITSIQPLKNYYKKLIVKYGLKKMRPCKLCLSPITSGDKCYCKIGEVETIETQLENNLLLSNTKQLS